jgi:branched-chain amino acid transport system permease protein
VAILAGVITGWETVLALRGKKARRIPALLVINLIVPAIVIGLILWLAPLKAPVWAQAALSIAIVTVLGPQLYRVAFQPVAGTSVRTLFVIAIALHFVLQGLGLLFFGADGFRADPLVDVEVSLGSLLIKAQTILSLAALGLLTAALYVFFEFTLLGKALRATAINRVGARIVGIRTPLAGKMAFALSGFIGGVAGILAVSSTTIYYDSGFLIGLKSVLGAICGAMLSYPFAIVGSIGIGVLEAFAAFWASAFTEAVVFSALVPVLLWLSLRGAPAEEGSEL